MTHKSKRNAWLGIGIFLFVIVPLIMLYNEAHAKRQQSLCDRYPMSCEVKQ